ncbi:hypothetical protein LTS18_005922 [Coniosporium uncinatum]|uniref:Uncharacterized protein n=1 Tax=Coniosporium uncinatum TaxID=93489 RepID=A0ACC3D4G2_9PEZI|nr:hypothetical protein LTS18_005922 [Coniosporium uncinatum]
MAASDTPAETDEPAISPASPSPLLAAELLLSSESQPATLFRVPTATPESETLQAVNGSLVLRSSLPLRATINRAASSETETLFKVPASSGYANSTPPRLLPSVGTLPVSVTIANDSVQEDPSTSSPLSSPPPETLSEIVLRPRAGSTDQAAAGTPSSLPAPSPVSSLTENLSGIVVWPSSPPPGQIAVEAPSSLSTRSSVPSLTETLSEIIVRPRAPTTDHRAAGKESKDQPPIPDLLNAPEPAGPSISQPNTNKPPKDCYNHTQLLDNHASRHPEIAPLSPRGKNHPAIPFQSILPILYAHDRRTDWSTYASSYGIEPQTLIPALHGGIDSLLASGAPTRSRFGGARSDNSTRTIDFLGLYRFLCQRAWWGLQEQGVSLGDWQESRTRVVVEEMVWCWMAMPEVLDEDHDDDDEEDEEDGWMLKV